MPMVALSFWVYTDASQATIRRSGLQRRRRSLSSTLLSFFTNPSITDNTLYVYLVFTRTSTNLVFLSRSARQEQLERTSTALSACTTSTDHTTQAQSQLALGSIPRQACARHFHCPTPTSLDVLLVLSMMWALTRLVGPSHPPNSCLGAKR